MEPGQEKVIRYQKNPILTLFQLTNDFFQFLKVLQKYANMLFIQRCPDLFFRQPIFMKKYF